MKKPHIDEIVAAVGSHFRTFGGGQGSEFNPLAEALKNQPLQFAAGVDVFDVVKFVVLRLSAEV